MAFATQHELVALKRRSPEAAVFNYEDRSWLSAHNITPTTARRILAAAKAAAMNRMQGNKYNRPWALLDVTEGLDRQQAWLGWEFETGFRNLQEYQRVINYMWQRQPRSAIDSEGYGSYPAELTFSPVNESDFLAEKSGIWQLLRYMRTHGISSDWIADNYVGTHLNVSTPTFRSLNRSAAGVVVSMMSESIRTLTPAQKQELFGRQPYGYGYFQAINSKQWAEFKLFKSTSNIDTFRKYADVAKRIAMMMESLSRFYADRRHVDNFGAIQGHIVDVALLGAGLRAPYAATTHGRALNSYEFLTGATDQLSFSPIAVYDRINLNGSITTRQINASMQAVAAYLADNPQQ